MIAYTTVTRNVNKEVLGSRLYRRRAGILEHLSRWFVARRQRLRRSEFQTESLAAENCLWYNNGEFSATVVEEISCEVWNLKCVRITKKIKISSIKLYVMFLVAYSKSSSGRHGETTVVISVWNSFGIWSPRSEIHLFSAILPKWP